MTSALWREVEEHSGSVPTLHPFFGSSQIEVLFIKHAYDFLLFFPVT